MTHSRPRSHRSACPHRLSAWLVVLLATTVWGLGCRAQNGNDVPAGTPVASFSHTTATGEPGLVVVFTDTSAGDVDSYLWDFGNGVTSTVASPTASYPDAGTYDVSLTVTGDRGTSTMAIAGLVVVADPPTAGFDCLPDLGFSPLLSACTSSAVGATEVDWDFGDGTTATGTSVTKTWDVVDTYTVTQTVTNAAGVIDATTATVEVLPISISATPPSGAPPGDVFFVGDTGGVAGDLLTWFVDGQVAGSSSGFVHPFRTPGTYAVEYWFASSSLGLTGQTSIQYVVIYGPPTAAFTPSASEGTGPLDVTFADESTGEITQWEWDFGDGSTCFYPETTDPNVCDSASPSHTYAAIGQYDVTLSVTGPGPDEGDPEQIDTIVSSDAVTVTLLDPSFEDQGVAAPLAGAWTPLVPAGAVATPDHVALSDTESAGADAGMPTDGSKWAALDGTGTDGSDPVETVENGLRQDFLRPPSASVIEFDYVFLYGEPPASTVLDAMTATVSDGTTSVEILSARADVATAYAGSSARYPLLGGNQSRATAVHTASLDLATAFPGAPSDTVYTLTIRLTNDLDASRSPRAYIDHVRFVAPADPLAAAFAYDDPVVAGEAVQFTDETCLDPGGTGCVDPTSWRWDFDTRLSTTAPDATGSGDQSPSYVFDEAGDYEVEFLARNADQESAATMTVSVLVAPVAIPGIASATSSEAPATITFEDLSTFAVGDLIDSWEWDFAGWAPASNLQTPPPITISQVGTWTIRLTVTTLSGLEDEGQVDVVLE